MTHFHASCFLCGARIVASDLLAETRREGVTTRKYECGMCAALHEIVGYIPSDGAGSTFVARDPLMVSRRQAVNEIDDLASAVANECGYVVPTSFLADLSQAMDAWATGSLPSSLAVEYQRLRGFREPLINPEATPRP